MSYRMAAQIAARQHRYMGHQAIDRGDIAEARRYLERARYVDPNGNHGSLEQRIRAAVAGGATPVERAYGIPASFREE